jgi:hypothetical protein
MLGWLTEILSLQKLKREVKRLEGENKILENKLKEIEKFSDDPYYQEFKGDLPSMSGTYKTELLFFREKLEKLFYRIGNQLRRKVQVIIININDIIRWILSKPIKETKYYETRKRELFKRNIDLIEKIEIKLCRLHNNLQNYIINDPRFQLTREDYLIKLFEESKKSKY